MITPAWVIVFSRTPRRPALLRPLLWWQTFKVRSGPKCGPPLGSANSTGPSLLLTVRRALLILPLRPSCASKVRDLATVNERLWDRMLGTPGLSVPYLEIALSCGSSGSIELKFLGCGLLSCASILWPC